MSELILTKIEPLDRSLDRQRSDRRVGKPYFFVNPVNLDRDRRLHLHEAIAVKTLIHQGL
ncbi:hypothetical protein PMH09_00355 [Roseofilum sp. BLCC_M143]|uniref:Uncharacterized protein n=1 Tax=Roseofilum casamattae BLCC-M143 TaxID=3022442 RepID=A0ABT7BR07_9CYAN|nr:hypothetical protein [Roseofilum casamattae BLCC-M143]